MIAKGFSVQNIVQVAFEGEFSICQTLEIIDSNYDEESIIEGLASGSLETTLDISRDAETYIERTSDCSRIAKIVSQEAQFEPVNYR